ncbi:MAG: hypothetical protein JW969_10195 [Spirochaetales bacterium]|nr:hypothetical protein [Spirochaetales bacterium]
MKKILTLILAIILNSAAFSQEPPGIVDTFIANFEKASPDVKLQILQDAAESKIPDIEPLYDRALEYVIYNADRLNTELVIRGIGQYAIGRIQAAKYKPARHNVWEVFVIDTDSYTRSLAMATLRDIAADDEAIIEKINKWLDSQNEVYRMGKPVDYQVIIQCIQTLGSFGNPGSFRIIFETMNLALNEATVNECEKALKSIQGDVKELYIEIIRNGPPRDKKTALEKILNSPDFNDADKAMIAEVTLNTLLHSAGSSKEEKLFNIEVRGIAVRALGERGWTNAAGILIEHFNQVLVEYERSLADKRYVIETIAALGNMKSHEAAKRLTLFLDLINTYTENGRTYDEQIVMATISSLRKLGDIVAHGSLLYTKYLNYSETVRKAANDALQNLKW